MALYSERERDIGGLLSDHEVSKVDVNRSCEDSGKRSCVGPFEILGFFSKLPVPVLLFTSVLRDSSSAALPMHMDNVLQSTA